MYAIEFRHDEDGSKRFLRVGDSDCSRKRLNPNRLVTMPADGTLFVRKDAAEWTAKYAGHEFRGNTIVGVTKMWED